MSSNTIKEVMNIGATLLKEAGIESNRVDSRVLISEALSMPIEEVILKGDDAISEGDFKKFMEMIKRRAKNEPVAYMLQKKEFYGIEFAVNQNVLIPRPDSETLVDEVLSYYKRDDSIDILELGVGSGCLLLTILKYMQNASGTAVDIKEEAINVTKSNYKNLSLKNSIEFIPKSWNNIEFDKKFDLIISNPPYIRKDHIDTLQEDVKSYEPLTALEGGADGLKAYNEIAPIIQNLLKKDGLAILECGENQHFDVSRIMHKYGLHTIKYSNDLTNKIRCVLIKPL